MGVPKFFRWLSERYPKIMQRHGVRPDPERSLERLGRVPPWLAASADVAGTAASSDAAGTTTANDGAVAGRSRSESDTASSPATTAAAATTTGVSPQHPGLPVPDPLSECGLKPEIDRLYIDVNGILHGCSHNNNSEAGLEGSSEVSLAEIARNVCYYLDRIVTEVARPRQLLYLAIDGVAPRAKLNQQRARRYRSGKEGEIERTVYDAHREAVAAQRQRDRIGAAGTGWREEDNMGGVEAPPSRSDEGFKGQSATGNAIKEIQAGRFTGKFETSETDPDEDNGLYDDNDDDPPKKFHSNAITPGTPFFQECTKHILDFIQDRMAHDPAWARLTVIFSGSNVPGEGEHKIMQFIREQRAKPGYDPNLRHCIMGQDGDLIMLGLATHEPNLTLLRERVLFDRRANEREELAEKLGLDLYLFNGNFEFLHMNVLRDYLALELETILPDSPFDLERSLDDFVFLTFLVGNDFLPHMPALDIADEAFDLLFYTYRALRNTQWLKESPDNPYLTHAGTIVSGKRLEGFLAAVGALERNYYEFKESVTDLDRNRRIERKYGRTQTPSDDVLLQKEEADRKEYRRILEASTASAIESIGQRKFTPVMSVLPTLQDEDVDHEQQVQRLHQLLLLSVSDVDEATGKVIDDTDLKGRYYADKFGFSPFDAEKHIALRKAYIEGLVWNLKYYYEGCVSWEWYYPYHYGPFMSDLVGLDDLLKEVSFEDKRGAPLKPFEQLLACLPASHAHLLPKPYRALMRDESSPIADFYPKSFVIDMNGKSLPWEAVVLLPFIDSSRLIDAAKTIDPEMLSEEERERNVPAETIVLTNKRPQEASSETSLSEPLVVVAPFSSTGWVYDKTGEKPVLLPEVLPGTEVPLPGFPTLRDGTITGLWRKYLPLNVHGSSSRYKIACLEMQNAIPEIIPLDAIAQQFIGTAVVINYPHFIEGLVTAVSDTSGIIRGKDSRLVPWTVQEFADRKTRTSSVISSYMNGEKLVGTGGLALAAGGTAMQDLDVLMFVRPMKELKELRDGTIVKTYASFEIEVPLFVTSWAPQKPDPRLANVPALLERDPYHAAEVVVTHRLNNEALQEHPGVSKIQGNAYQFPAPRGLRKSRKRSAGARGFHTAASNLSLTVNSPRDYFSGMVFHAQLLCKPLNRECHEYISFRQNALMREGKHPIQFRSIINRAPGKLKLARGFLLAGLLFSIASTVSGGLTGGFEVQPLESHTLFPSHNDRSIASASSLPKPYDSAPPLLFEHGTTTLSFIFEHGMIVAVDSRASLGSFVGSKTVQKVLPIHSHMLATMAGGAADCSYWIRHIRGHAKLFALQNNDELLSVTEASRLLANILYRYRGRDLSVGTMLVGYDGDQAKIYYVDDTGMRIDGDMFAVGSGSTFALGILDTERKWNMNVDEAVGLGIKAIRHATFRDAGSGGWINVYLITKEKGWKHVFAQDLAGLHPQAMDRI